MGKKIEEELKEICQLLMEGKLSFEQLKQERDIYLENMFFSDALVRLYYIQNIFFQYASEELKNDKKFVSELCKFYLYNFKYISEELKKDKSFVLAVVQSCPNIINYVNEDLKNDREFVEKLSNASPYVIENLDDREFVKKLIDINPEVIRFSKYVDDKEMALIAVSKDGSLLEYLSNRLKNDKEVVFEACKHSVVIFESAGEELKNDRDYVKKIIELNPYFIKYTRYRDDKELALKVVLKDGNLLRYLSNRLKNDEEVILAALKQNGNALSHAGKKIKMQKKYVINALKNDNSYYFFMFYNDDSYYKKIFESFIKDKDVINAALNSDKLVKFLYKKYYQKYVSNLEDKTKDNIYDFVKECLINKNIILNLYYPYGINNDLEVGLSRLNVFYEKELENKFKTIKKEVSVYYRNVNIKIYNDIIKTKDDAKKLNYILNKNRLNQDNIYDFIINNKYLDKQMKESLYSIVEAHYGKAITVLDIIDLINDMLDNELSLEEMFRDNVVLKEKIISKKLFYKIYNDTIENNPFLYDYIKTALSENKRRGFKKLLRLGNSILSSDFNSLEEYNAKFSEYSPIKVLKMLKETDLYPRLLEKFRNIDDIDLDEEFDKGKSRS